MQYKKYVLHTVALSAGIILLWYVIVRLTSPWTVIKTFIVPQKQSYTTQSPTHNLRVGCYNIAHGRGAKLNGSNWAGGSNHDKIKRIKKIGALIQDARLDIVVLNEVDFSSIWSGHIDQAELLAKEAGYPYVLEQRNYNVAIPFISLKFGNAILSRFPISDTTFLDFPDPSKIFELLSGGCKQGVVAAINLPDKSVIQVAAVHLSVDSEPLRTASVQMIMDYQRNSPLPLLIMGDFNCWPREHYTDKEGQNAIEILLYSRQVNTVLPGRPIPSDRYTYPSENPSRVLDWIFVSSEWQIQKLDVIKTPLSDHLPVFATLIKE